MPVKIGVRQEILTVEVLQDGEVICAVNTSPEGIINPSAMMIGVLSTRPQNLSCLDISQEDDTLQRYEFWKTVELTPETLPDDGQLPGPRSAAERRLTATLQLLGTQPAEPPLHALQIAFSDRIEELPLQLLLRCKEARETNLIARRAAA